VESRARNWFGREKTTDTGRLLSWLFSNRGVTSAHSLRQNIGVKHDKSERQARFDQVLAQYRGRLGRIALTYAGREADDLLQEILLQIWRSLPGFEDRSSMGTWCYRIALNTAISWKRKTERKHVEKASSALDQHPAPRSDGSHHETGLLKRFLATLGDVDQAILLMHLDNVDHSDIAKALGVSDGAIRTRMSRLRQKLAAWDSPLEIQTKQGVSAKEVADG
jgi:RNA polymerase sigma-70 factor (ECF subfamily)